MRYPLDRKSTRLNSSHGSISYAVFCLKKKKQNQPEETTPSATAPMTTATNARATGRLQWRNRGGCLLRGRLSGGIKLFFFFFNDTATTEIYPLPLHDALPISRRGRRSRRTRGSGERGRHPGGAAPRGW